MIIFETLPASPPKDETRKGLGMFSRLPRQRCEHTHLCMYSNTATQGLSNPYTWPENKGRNTPFILYIFLSILLPPRLFLATLASGLRQLIFYFLKESKIKKKTQKTPQQFGFKFVFRNLSIWNFMFVFLPAFSFQLNSITFPLNTMVSKIKIFSIHLKMLMLIKVDQKTFFEIQQNQTELWQDATLSFHSI